LSLSECVRITLLKGGAAFGSFTVTQDITDVTRAKVFGSVGKVTPVAARFSTVGVSERECIIIAENMFF
jgi:catalase